jgi:hypothetical protein
MGGASIAAGEVAILELGEMFEAVEAAPGDKFPLGSVTPVEICFEKHKIIFKQLAYLFVQ